MGLKARLKNQFRFSVDYLALRHENVSDFYLSCWQSSRSALPLLLLRLLLFLGWVGIVAFSFYLTIGNEQMAYWAIYMTQWALVSIGFATGLGTVVSAVAYFGGPIDGNFGVPWYVKCYWVAYCIALPLAFFVTVFYYSFLFNSIRPEMEVNPILDVLTHGINSVIMICLMVTSQHPIYFLQVIYLLLFLLAYVTFSVIYYFAGGTSPWGDPWVYPMVDWTNPGPTIGVVAASSGLLTIAAAVAVLLSLLRDWLSRKWNSISTYAL